MTTDNTPNLYLFLGISDERFNENIKPIMDTIFLNGGLVDQSLIAIEQHPDLFPEEKAYCCYCIGRCVGIEEINVKTHGLARKLGLID